MSDPASHFLITYAGATFLAWIVAVLSIVQALRHTQSGHRIAFMRKLSWWKFNEAEQYLSPQGIGHLRRMRIAILAFLIMCGVVVVTILLLLFWPR